MAITLEQAPEILSPVYNDLTHVVSSTSTAQPNFKFICDIYINGGATKIHRESVPPHPVYGVATFNPARIIEAYITNDFDSQSIASYACTNSTATYILKFGEEYGLSSSGTTVYSDLLVTSSKFVFNGIFDWEDWCDYHVSHWQSGGSGKFLTNSPDNKKVYIDSTYASGNEFVYMNNASSGSIYYLHVDTYDVNNNLVGVYIINNTYQALSNSAWKMVRFPSGYNMNNITAGNYTALGGSPSTIIGTSVASYQVYPVKFDGTVQSAAAKIYNIERTCSRYPLYEIYFQNKLGGYDTFVFEKKTNFKSEIKKENYKSNLGRLTSATTYTKAVTHRGVTQYATNIEDTLTLRSDYVSEATMLWLEELVTSPDAYMLKNSNHVPITIVNTSFERKYLANEKLFALTIEVKFSYKRSRQRG